MKFQPILKFLKKNLVSVICGVVAIASVILSFYPVANWYDSPDTDPTTLEHKALLEKLQDRAAVAGKINTLLTQKRTLPLVDENGGDPPALTHFPNDDIITRAEGLFADMKTNCDSLKTEFDKLNRHALLVDGSLPDPNTQVRIQFREDYLGNALDGAKSPDNLILGSMLNAGWPLTDTQITAADDAKKAANEATIPLIAGKQDPAQLKAVDEKWLKDKPAYELNQQLAVATNHGVYVKPGMLNNALITQTAIPSPYAIWTTQMQLWIEQDIAGGIQRANSDPGSATIKADIQQAPIKQWVTLVLPTPLYVSAGPTGDPAAKTPDTPTADITGRVTNGLYDTVHATIILDIDESKINQVLSGLTAGQVLTVTRFDIAPVDGPQMMVQNFVYGNRPCVRVTIDLEDMFLRSWMDAYKPAGIAAAITGGREPAPTDAP